MIKAMAPLPGGGALLVLGITEENVRELKQDHPIVFQASEMHLPLPTGSVIVVTYAGPSGEIALPADEDVPNVNQLVIILDDALLAGLAKRMCDDLIPGTPIRLCLVYRETEEALSRVFVPFIGPRTVSTRTGFPPGYDVSRN